ncbi:MAG: RES family NAD+ phosphorylase [Candidatus Omnitrophota bacterium]
MPMDLTSAEESRVERLRKKIQPWCISCTYCQPFDSEDKETFWINGSAEDLEEVFDEFNVPAKLRDRLVEELCCGNCRAQFSRGDTIGVKTQAEVEEENEWERLRKKYIPAIKDFGEFLEKYPYLGCAHKMGRKIYNALRQFPKVGISNEIWWRARKPEGAKKFLTKDMLPPKQPEAEGRFNHYGQRVFYLAESKDAALIETLEKGENIAWIQRFVITEIDNILNLTMLASRQDELEGLPWFINVKLRSLVPGSRAIWRPEYFIPRFIADCARSMGFNGILFDSPRHKGKNLVLLNWHNQIKAKGKPRIAQVRSPKKKQGGGAFLASFDFNQLDIIRDTQ